MIAATLALSQIHIKPPVSRFELAYPLPGGGGVMVDRANSGWGVAQQLARAKGLQARIMWIDGTANLDKVQNEPMIREWVGKIKAAGFNTIVFDVKPISGQVLYKSKIAPKIKAWKGKTLPEDFDPLPAMCAASKAAGLSLLVSLNAFSEGHSLFKEGPGYDMVHLQTVLYEAFPTISPAPVGIGNRNYRLLHPKLNEAPGLNEVSVFTDPAKLPKSTEDAFALSLDRLGRVVDGFDAGGTGDGVPTIPAGGVVLWGTQGAASLLKGMAKPGFRPVFDSGPTFVPISDRPERQYPLMMNPHHPEVQGRALAIVEELLRGYDIDGIVYDDRLRYAGLDGDFSPLARTRFEVYVGAKLRWPDDVFKFTYTQNLTRGVKPGRFYDAWVTWRAQEMRNWVLRVGKHVKTLKQGALFGVYAGSWYGEYPQYGVNYGSDSLDAGFWFMNDAYRKTGFASNIDLIMTGCYYPTATIFDALSAGLPIGRTVEAAGQLSNRVIRDQAWVYGGISLDQFKTDPDGLMRVLQGACASTQGVMVFDISHDVEPMWGVFAAAFSKSAKAPHQVVGLLDKVRKTRASLDKSGIRDRAVPISAGAGGVGF